MAKAKYLAPVVQTSDSAIHRINLYPADSVIDFCNTYPLDSVYPVDSVIQRLNNRGLIINIEKTVTKPSLL